MIQLFPRIRNRMYLLWGCLLAMAAIMIILSPDVNPLLLLLFVLIGALIIAVLQSLRAVGTHNAMIALLYDQLNAEGFLAQYEPLMQLSVKPSLSLMVRLHVSNAYCAQGRFDDAIALLSSFPVNSITKKEDELLTRFSLASNICHCYEQKGDVKQARKYLNRLLELKAQLESLQQSKPEKKRMVFSTDLCELIMTYLETGKTDIEALKTLAKSNKQLLHKVTVSLWIARCHLDEHNRREAEALLERIVNVAPKLYPGRVARELLDQLPEKAK